MTNFDKERVSFGNDDSTDRLLRLGSALAPQGRLGGAFLSTRKVFGKRQLTSDDYSTRPKWRDYSCFREQQHKQTTGYVCCSLATVGSLLSLVDLSIGARWREKKTEVMLEFLLISCPFLIFAQLFEQKLCFVRHRGTKGMFRGQIYYVLTELLT